MVLVLCKACVCVFMCAFPCLRPIGLLLYRCCLSVVSPHQIASSSASTKRTPKREGHRRSRWWVGSSPKHIFFAQGLLICCCCYRRVRADLDFSYLVESGQRPDPHLSSSMGSTAACRFGLRAGSAYNPLIEVMVLAVAPSFRSACVCVDAPCAHDLSCSCYY